MQSVNFARNVADRRIPEKQEDKTTHKEKTQGIRSVQQKQEVVQSLNQIMPVSDTYRRTTTDYVVAENTSETTPETVSAREWKSEAPEIKIRHTFKIGKKLQKTIFESTRKLEKWVWNKPGALSRCMDIIAEFNDLSTKGHRSPDNDTFIKDKLAPFAHMAIGPALESLQRHADTGYGWEYITELQRIARYFDVLTAKECPDARSHKETLAKLYRQYINNELNYMEFMKDSLFTAAVMHAIDNIDELLLSDNSPDHSLKLLNENEIKEFTRKEDDLFRAHDTCFSMKDASADRITEEFDELERKISQGTTDTLLKRKYHDALTDQIREITAKSTKKENPALKHLFILRETLEVCRKYIKFVGELRLLHPHLIQVVKRSTKAVLHAIQEGSDNSDHWKEEALELIGCFHKEGWLNEKTKDLYHSMKQLIMNTAIPTNKTMDFQCKQQIDEIEKCIHSTSENCYLQAAKMLKQFLEKNEVLIKTLPSAITIDNRIRHIKKIIHVELFKGFLDAVQDCQHKHMSAYETSYKMCEHQARFIQLAPYAFVFRSNDVKQNWLKLVCSAWLVDLEKIHTASSCGEADADTLLSLKHVAPDVPNPFIRFHLEQALKAFFQFMLTHDTDPELTEKITELSAWIDHLTHLHTVKGSLLQEYNEQWKKRHPGVANKEAMTSSGTSTFVDPGIASASQEASSYHPSMMQPLTAPPHMLTPDTAQRPSWRPLTAPSYMLAPATAQWPSRQPVSPPYCAPMTQSPAKIKLHPTPTQLPLSAHHEPSTSDRPHFPAHPPAQACSYQPPIGTPIQSQWQITPRQQPLFQPGMSDEYRPWETVGEIERQISLPSMTRHGLPQIPIQGGTHQQQHSPCMPVADSSPARSYPSPTQQPLSVHHGAPIGQPHFPAYPPAQAYSCQPPIGTPVQPQWQVASQKQPLFQPGMSAEYGPRCSFSSDIQQVSEKTVGEELERQISLLSMTLYELVDSDN